MLTKQKIQPWVTFYYNGYIFFFPESCWPFVEEEFLLLFKHFYLVWIFPTFSKLHLDYIKSKQSSLPYACFVPCIFSWFLKRKCSSPLIYNKQENLHKNILKPKVINTVIKLYNCKLTGLPIITCYPLQGVERYLLDAETGIRHLTGKMLLTLSSSQRVIPRGKK